MAVTLEVRQALIIDGRVVTGSKISNQSVTLTNGQAYVVESKTIADAYGEDALWASGDGGLDTFTNGWVYSDQDIVLQLRNDDTSTPEYALLFVRANELTAIPAKIGGGTADRLDGAALVDNADYADVDLIEVQRDAADGSGDAAVTLALFS